MEKTELKITKTFWAIVREADPNGYHTGKNYRKTTLYQTNSASELSKFLSDGSVESGESMGDFIFKVLAMSHSPQVLDASANYEENGVEE